MLVSGNIAKYYIAQELEKLFQENPEKLFRILDVGITGPSPLNFWLPLFEYRNFELVGTDVDVASIDTLKARDLPDQLIRLEALSGYDLSDKFGEAEFDLIVSTQVLEHMKYPERFIKEAAKILKSGGEFHLTFDSSLHPRGGLTFKELVKRLVVFVSNNERYHDRSLDIGDVAKAVEEKGFKLEIKRLFSLHPLKELVAWETPEELRDRFMEEWLRFENYLHESGHFHRAPERYLTGYCKAIKK